MISARTAGLPPVFMTVLLGACAFDAPAIAAEPDTAPVPVYADAAELRQAAQEVVQRFAERVAAAGLAFDDPPAVEVRTTPVLVYYGSRDNVIGVPWWQDLEPQQRDMFTYFAGGDEVEGERIFRAFFNRLL